MTPNEAAEEIQKQASNAVRRTALEIKARFRKKTPPKYKKTRRAFFAQGKGTRAIVGLKFNKQYPPRGTATAKRFKKHWQEIRPQVPQILAHQLNDILKEM